MKPLIEISLAMGIVLGQLIQPRPAYVDTGPKPTMEFQVRFDSSVKQASILSGILFECDQTDCSDATPLEALGPQGLYCEPDSCRAIGYGFSQYHMLEIEFSDGVARRSNVFETDGFDSFYTVSVRANDLLVEPRINPLAPPVWLIVLIACVCILIAGGLALVALIFTRRRASKD